MGPVSSNDLRSLTRSRTVVACLTVAGLVICTDVIVAQCQAHRC